jgi:ketosteroid isomerase-like protein
MSGHPNFVTTQRLWEAVAEGDFSTPFDAFADDIVVDNGPGAGPWRHFEGKEAFFTMAMHFVPFFHGTWKQEGQCIYADDGMSITVVHETGKAPSGDVFNSRAVWIFRFRPDGKMNRLWTTDVAHEELEDFWRRNPLEVQTSPHAQGRVT